MPSTASQRMLQQQQQRSDDPSISTSPTLNFISVAQRDAILRTQSLKIQRKTRKDHGRNTAFHRLDSKILSFASIVSPNSYPTATKGINRLSTSSTRNTRCRLHLTINYHTYACVYVLLQTQAKRFRTTHRKVRIAHINSQETRLVKTLCCFCQEKVTERLLAPDSGVPKRIQEGACN